MWSLLPQYVAIYWFLVVFCLGLVGIRLYVQLTTRIRPWRELLLFYAWLSMLGDAIISTIMWKTDSWYFSAEEGGSKYKSDEIIVLNGKLSFADRFTWTFGCAACRLLLLMMYKDFCSRQAFPKTWWLIRITWVVLIVATVAVNLIYVFLLCYPHPISELWTPGSTCLSMGYNWTYTWVGLCLVVAIDTSIYVIPIILVFQLRNLTKTQKLGAAAMFAIGFINVGSVFALVALIIAAFTVPQPHELHLDAVFYFIVMTQLPTAIMVLCIPQLRIIGRWSFAKKIQRSIVSLNSRSDGARNTHLQKRPGYPPETRSEALQVDIEKDLVPTKTVSHSSQDEKVTISTA